MGPKPIKNYVGTLEKKVDTLNRLLEVTNTLNSALLSDNVRITELLSFLMDTAAEITDSEGASVLLWDSKTEDLFFAATTSDNAAAKALIGKPVPLDSIAGMIFREKDVIQVDDAASDPRHYSQVDEDIEFTTRSLLGVPMIAKNKAIGVLEVVNKRTLPWTEEDRANLSMLAGEAAIVIDVARLVLDLQKANEELSELDQLKSDFIAIASHELRTPLGIILGYASFLQEAQDESVSDHASKVMDSALQLRRIIEDMINLRYIKQKPSDLQRDNITLQELVDDIVRDFKTVVEASNHYLDVSCADGDAKLHIDRSRVSMALTNILNNAAAFTPEGGSIKIEAYVPDEKEAYVSITDTGIGMEQSQLERIFEEFYQVEEHMTRHHGGLGIGLTIAKGLIEVHGGRIEASSLGLDKGSTFTVILPLAETSDLE